MFDKNSVSTLSYSEGKFIFGKWLSSINDTYVIVSLEKVSNYTEAECTIINNKEMLAHPYLRISEVAFTIRLVTHLLNADNS